MPLTINIGISRKIGQSNFGSRGASVGLQIEADSRSIDQPERLRESIDQLFELANQSIDDELQKLRPIPTIDALLLHESRQITAKQYRALMVLTSQLDVDLSTACQNRFQCEAAASLTREQASILISELQSAVRDTASSQN
jgi:hypothetical protein